MPACLMELGFISNPDEERFMNAESSTDKYARGFLKAFINYKNKYFDGLHVPYRPQDIKDTQIPQVVPDEYKEKEQQKQQEQAAAAKKRSQPAQNVKETPKETAKETPKDAPKETPKDAPKETPKESPKDAPANAEITPLMGAVSQAPIFKIQILTGRTRIKTTDRQFKGLADVDCYEEGGLFKYTVGASADYNAIARQRREILDKFPEAFIIAFKNGQKMNVNEAISEFKKNKGK
jgi:N-acetylmuramoyl-L-alanine amidase